MVGDAYVFYRRRFLLKIVFYRKQGEMNVPLKHFREHHTTNTITKTGFAYKWFFYSISKIFKAFHLSLFL